MLLCGLTDKVLHRICGSQYDHPGSAIGYWPETCLGHVYIVLELVVSARLKFGDNRYYEFMRFDVPKVVQSPGWDRGYDEESRNGRYIKIDILEGYIRTPEECLMCHQTSQRNWVIIKVLYRCIRRYFLGWRISRLGFVTPIVGEVSLGPLGNAHHISLASIATTKLAAGWCMMERVKRLAGNEIELGIEKPTIKSPASNIPMTKGTTYIVMRFDR